MNNFTINHDEISQIVREHIELITIDGKGMSEALERCTKFLTVQSVLSNYEQELVEELGKLETREEAIFGKQYANAGGNTTDKRNAAHSSKEYVEACEERSKLKAQLKWVERNIKIFDNAHIVYRQVAVK